MIEFRNVSKSYGKKRVLENLSFTIEKGETVGLLGLNGAGKSTTMNLMTGYISPDKGEILIDGTDICREHKKAAAKIGYLPEIPPLYSDMTVTEFINFVFDIKGARQKNIGTLLERTGLSDVSGRMIKRLSKGYKQRVGLAAALAADPEILVLDEPTVGLDPRQIAEIREFIKEVGKDRTVLISSHILSEIQLLCGRVIVLKDGKKAADGKPCGISEKNIIQLETYKPSEEIIRRIDGVQRVDASGTKYEITASSDIRRELFYELAKADCPIMSLEYKKESLEDMFLNIVNGEESGI